MILLDVLATKQNCQSHNSARLNSGSKGFDFRSSCGIFDTISSIPSSDSLELLHH
jgi:hypothetical protein